MVPNARVVVHHPQGEHLRDAEARAELQFHHPPQDGRWALPGGRTDTLFAPGDSGSQGQHLRRPEGDGNSRLRLAPTQTEDRISADHVFFDGEAERSAQGDPGVVRRGRRPLLLNPREDPFDRRRAKLGNCQSPNEGRQPPHRVPVHPCGLRADTANSIFDPLLEQF